MATDQGLYEERKLSTVLHNFHIYKYIQGRMSSQRVILQVQCVHVCVCVGGGGQGVCNGSIF